MASRSYLIRTTPTARSLLRSSSTRCVQGDFTLGTLIEQSPIHNLKTYTRDNNRGGISDTDACLSGSGAVAGSSSELPYTGMNQQCIDLRNPFQHPE